MGRMGVMQVTHHEVVDMIAVRHCLMAAVRAVDVRFLVAGTRVAWSTSFGVGRANVNLVF